MIFFFKVIRVVIQIKNFINYYPQIIQEFILKEFFYL